jgi:hypothetical protein
MKTPLYREDDKEFLGFITEENGSWVAQTIFGYPIARVATQKEAEATVREKGLGFLMGVWQYFDKDDQEWFPCVIQEASEHRVTVVRTNEMGYQDAETYKLVMLKEPKENILIKNT